jgi:hypothetical protein
MPLHKDLSEFIESLNSAGVEYLIVGGVAAAWNGHPRFTADIEFLEGSWVAASESQIASAPRTIE